MKEIDKILVEDESILWEGKPKFWPFFLSRSIFVIIIALFLLIPLISALTGRIVIQGDYYGTNVLAIPHFWIAIFLILGTPIYVGLSLRYSHYAITTKRILFQKGIVGRDFEIADFDKITNAEVNVGVFDKLFGGRTGSIKISTAGSFTQTRKGPINKPYVISNIENPYEVFKTFQKVSHDVRADISYPNELRPKENQGYKTEYKSKDEDK